MPDWTLPMTGGCRCGQVRFEVTLPPLLTMACHCTGCQKMTASAFSLSIAIPLEGFAVTAGDPVIGGMHGELEHYFCPWCMSWMFTRMDGMPFVNLRSTLLDDTSRIAPFIESCTTERLPWATTSAVHSYPGFPPHEAFAALLAEFAARP